MSESTYHQIHFAWAEPTLLGRVGPGPDASSLPESDQPALRSWRDRLVPALTVDYRSALPDIDRSELPETLWSRVYADGQATLVYRWPGNVREAHAWAIVGPARGLTLPRILSLHENPNTRPAAGRPPEPGWQSMPTLEAPTPWELTAAPGAVRTRDRRAAETGIGGEPVLVGTVASALERPDRPIRIALEPERADLWQATQIRLLWGMHRVLHDILTPPRAVPAAGWQWSFSTYDPDLRTEGQHLAFGPPEEGTHGPFLHPPCPDHSRAAERLVEVLRDEGGDALAEQLRERGITDAPTFGDRRALLLEWLDPSPKATPGGGTGQAEADGAEAGTAGTAGGADTSGVTDEDTASGAGAGAVGAAAAVKASEGADTDGGGAERTAGSGSGAAGSATEGFGDAEPGTGRFDGDSTGTGTGGTGTDRFGSRRFGTEVADEDDIPVAEPLPDDDGTAGADPQDPDDSVHGLRIEGPDGYTPDPWTSPASGSGPGEGAAGYGGDTAPPAAAAGQEPFAHGAGAGAAAHGAETGAGTEIGKASADPWSSPVPGEREKEDTGQTAPDRAVGAQTTDRTRPRAPSVPAADAQPLPSPEPLPDPEPLPEADRADPLPEAERSGEVSFARELPHRSGPSRSLFDEDRTVRPAPAARPIFDTPEPHGAPSAPDEGPPPLRLQHTPTPAETFERTTDHAPAPSRSEDRRRSGGRKHAEEVFGGPARTRDEEDSGDTSGVAAPRAVAAAPVNTESTVDSAPSTVAGTNATEGPDEPESESPGRYGRSPDQAPPLAIGPDEPSVITLDYAVETAPEIDPSFDDSGANWPAQYADLPLARLERWHTKHGPEGAHIDVVDAREAIQAERLELHRVREERDHYHTEVQDLRREIAQLDRPFLDGNPEQAGRARVHWLARLLLLVLMIVLLLVGLEIGSRLGLGVLDMLSAPLS